LRTIRAKMLHQRSIMSVLSGLIFCRAGLKLFRTSLRGLPYHSGPRSMLSHHNTGLKAGKITDKIVVFHRFGLVLFLFPSVLTRTASPLFCKRSQFSTHRPPFHNAIPSHQPPPTPPSPVLLFLFFNYGCISNHITQIVEGCCTPFSRPFGLSFVFILR